jgi:hypothetical protein
LVIRDVGKIAGNGFHTRCATRQKVSGYGFQALFVARHEQNLAPLFGGNARNFLRNL